MSLPLLLSLLPFQAMTSRDPWCFCYTHVKYSLAREKGIRVENEDRVGGWRQGVPGIPHLGIRSMSLILLLKGKKAKWGYLKKAAAKPHDGA